MLKFKMLLFAVVGAFAVLSTAVAAGEELREAGAVIKENGWTNFEEVLALAEAGKLKTGEFRYDWPILMAKFRTGKITARELWTQCHALAHNPPTSDELWPLWFTLPRHIVQYGNDPEFSEEVLSALKSDAPGRRGAAAGRCAGSGRSAADAEQGRRGVALSLRTEREGAEHDHGGAADSCGRTASRRRRLRRDPDGDSAPGEHDSGGTALADPSADGFGGAGGDPAE